MTRALAAVLPLMLWAGMARAQGSVAGTGTITYNELHCVIILPRQMFPRNGISQPDQKEYASIIWENSDGSRSSIIPMDLPGCIIEEPK